MVSHGYKYTNTVPYLSLLIKCFVGANTVPIHKKDHTKGFWSTSVELLWIRHSLLLTITSIYLPVPRTIYMPYDKIKLPSPLTWRTNFAEKIRHTVFTHAPPPYFTTCRRMLRFTTHKTFFLYFCPFCIYFTLRAYNFYFFFLFSFFFHILPLFLNSFSNFPLKMTLADTPPPWGGGTMGTSPPWGGYNAYPPSSKLKDRNMHGTIEATSDLLF